MDKMSLIIVEFRTGENVSSSLFAYLLSQATSHFLFFSISPYSSCLRFKTIFKWSTEAVSGLGDSLQQIITFNTPISRFIGSSLSLRSLPFNASFTCGLCSSRVHVRELIANLTGLLLISSRYHRNLGASSGSSFTSNSSSSSVGALRPSFIWKWFTSPEFSWISSFDAARSSSSREAILFLWSRMD